MRASPAWTPILAGLFLVVLIMSTTAQASGSGYNLSYTRAPGSTSPAAVDLVSVSSNDPGGNNITASFSTASAIDLSSGDYIYIVYFGGTGTSNSTAYVDFSNNTTAGEYYSSNSGSFSAGVMPFVLTNGGSTLSFSIAKASVGPASNFSIDVYAEYATTNQVSFSWLGTDYNSASGPGGGTCTSAGCAPSSGGGVAGGVAATPLWIYAGVAVAVVVGLLVALIFLMRRRRGAMGAPPQPYAAPPAPGAYPVGSPPPAPPPPSPPSAPPGTG
jgi:hypothetical protein